MKCLICRTADTHRHACDTCLTDTRRRLRELELYAAWLRTPTLLAPTRGAGGRGAPGYGSRPPIRLDAVAMADPRSRVEPPDVDEDRGIGLDDDTTLPILDTLHTLANYIRAVLGDRLLTRPTIYGEIGYLLGHLDWAANQPGIATLAQHIRDLHTQARATARDQPPRPLGTCLTVGCDGQVYEPPPRRDTTRCTACNRPYTGLDLVRLRTQES